jgi:hypothetical protein
MDNYLRQNKRGKLSAIMIAGVWIEGLYLGTQVAKHNPSEKLRQSIGEQKTMLNQLMIILSVYKKDEFISNLIKDLKVIQEDFNQIKIRIEPGDPEPVVKDGKLTIIQHDKSIVEMSDEQLDAIIKKAETIRNKLTNLK